MKIKDLLKDAYQEGMTVEEIEAALENIVMPEDNSAEIDRLKTALSKSNSEAADYKRQLREKLSTDEIKAKEDAEAHEKLQSDYDALVRKVNISENKARLLALGYEDKLANETAEAMVNGEIEKVIVNQQKHLEAIRKEIRSEILKETPKPDGGNASEGMTKEKLRGMSAQERYEFSVNHPEEYKQIYGGN